MAANPLLRSGRFIRRKRLRRHEMRGAALLPVVLIAAAAQQPAQPVEFICPMDPDVRSASPGKCPRCGMPLEAGIQEPLKYRLRLTVAPQQVPAGKPVELQFELIDPRTE